MGITALPPGRKPLPSVRRGSKIPTIDEDLPGLIDYPLVRPELTDVQVLEGLETAKRYHIGSVLVRPCDIDLAARTLGGGEVKAGAVCGFPHGSANTATKLYEARDLLRRGARIIDMVASISKLVSREFQHVQMELLQMAELCHKEGATLRITLENAYLTDELKIIACRCAERAEVDSICTSTGFAPSAYSLDDLKLMRKHLPEETGIAAQGEIRTVEEAMAVREAGAGTLVTTAATELLEAWKIRLAARTDTIPAPEPRP